MAGCPFIGWVDEETLSVNIVQEHSEKFLNLAVTGLITVSTSTVGITESATEVLSGNKKADGL